MAVDDSYTKSLLHFDGVDASTTFTDESGKTWTHYGDAQIDTAQSVFGGASGLLDGAGDYITTPDHDDFYLADGNWTFDFRLRYSDKDSAAYPTVASQYDDADNYFYIRRNRDLNKFNCSGAVGGVSIFSFYCNWIPANDTWYHIEVSRNGDTPLIFINGVSQSITQVTPVAGKNMGNLAGVFTIGRFGTSNNIAGWIDEFRFSNGICRHTADFTSPTSAYPLPISEILTPMWFM